MKPKKLRRRLAWWLAASLAILAAVIPAWFFVQRPLPNRNVLAIGDLALVESQVIELQPLAAATTSVPRRHRLTAFKSPAGRPRWSSGFGETIRAPASERPTWFTGSSLSDELNSRLCPVELYGIQSKSVDPHLLQPEASLKPALNLLTCQLDCYIVEVSTVEVSTKCPIS